MMELRPLEEPTEVVDDTFTCTLVVYAETPVGHILEVKVNDTTVGDGGTIDVPAGTVNIKVSVTNAGYDGIIWCKVYVDDVEVTSDSATILTGYIEEFSFDILFIIGTYAIKIEVGHYA